MSYVELDVTVGSGDDGVSPHVWAERVRRALVAAEVDASVSVEVHTGECGDCEATPAEHGAST